MAAKGDDRREKGHAGKGVRGGAAAIMEDPRFVAFVDHFNGDRDYFECHEVMEELWLDNGRDPVLQGLLQAAVGLYHWRNDNRAGAVKLFAGSLRKLAGAPAVLHGLDLALLRECVRSSLLALCPKLAEQPEMLAALEGRTAPPPGGPAPASASEIPALPEIAPAPFQPFALRVVDAALEAAAADRARKREAGGHRGGGRKHPH
ncbi:MAG: hypothetical protein BAA02_09995 [Paenibacillaceae bacterium ZCTH02-B3]|nr:MAG: hypothetical protein BAA02_09995 [Paenibacillaceae bacterium ZCTH02-B3]